MRGEEQRGAAFKNKVKRERERNWSGSRRSGKGAVSGGTINGAER